MNEISFDVNVSFLRHDGLHRRCHLGQLGTHAIGGRDRGSRVGSYRVSIVTRRHFGRRADVGVVAVAAARLILDGSINSELRVCRFLSV